MLLVLHRIIKGILLHKIKGLVNPHPGLGRLLLSLPPMIKINSADTANGIGHHIHNRSLAERYEILMDFITNTVQYGGPDAQQKEPSLIRSERQCFISPVKKDAQEAVSPKVQDFIRKSKAGNFFRAGVARLDVNGQAVNNQRQPADEKIPEF
jgi:hypothetical protein